MNTRKAHRAAFVFLPMLMVCACAWEQLNAFDVGLDTADASAPSPTTGSDTTVPNEASLATAADDGVGQSEASGPVDAYSDDGASQSLPCTSAQMVIKEWAFDASAEGWAIDTGSGVQGSLSWTASTGYPSAGALSVDVTPFDAAGPGAWVVYATPLDLTGRTISAWVWLESGPSPNFKTFVQTGAQWVWADNGAVYLTPHTWTCVWLDVSSPAYNGPAYDPSSVIRIGFQALSPSPFRMYIDSVRYY